MFPTYNALNKNLIVADNFNQAYETIAVIGNSAPASNIVSFLNPIQGNPTGVSVVNVEVTGTPTQVYPTAAVQVFWTFDGTSITIGSITGLSTDVNYSLTLKVE